MYTKTKIKFSQDFKYVSRQIKSKQYKYKKRKFIPSYTSAIIPDINLYINMTFNWKKKV